jgi:isoquinoline 1-oxidoreductase alpha subunit
MTPLSVNGKPMSVDADPETPLLWVLRDFLELTGTKFGCGMALCGACTVHVDGKPTRSCVTPLAAVTGRRITTIEGIGHYCQPGQIMSASALLNSNKEPSDAQIDAAMSGNICRCATYPRIRAAIKRAAKGLA